MVNMNPQYDSDARRRGRRGLSLPEAMISLVITSILLLAVATAFSASCSAIEANDRFFRSSQAARVAMNQLLLDIRNTTSLVGGATPDVTSTSIVIRRPPLSPALVGQQLVYLSKNPQNAASTETQRTYAYDSANKRLTLQVSYDDGTSSPVYELAGNVTAFSFGTPDTMSGDNGVTLVIRVPVTLTVAAGGASVTLNGASGPRQYLAY